MQRSVSAPNDLPNTRTREALSTRLIIAADRRIYRFSKHWLFAFNAVLAAFVLCILAAPILQSLGYTQLSRPIYRVFGLFCHQRDDRCFHILGEKYSCCERCTAVHCSLALFGLLFTFVRTRIGNIRYTGIVLLASPLVVDGLAVGADIYAGNVVIRVLTGALFGLGTIWLLYPRFEMGFQQTRTRLESLFDRLTAQGRAEPLSR